MKPVSILLRQGKKKEVWDKYCGFTSISVQEFMDIQYGLLMEQIDRLWESKLGRNILGESKPKSVDEFRKKTPLTKYEDYLPYLEDRNEDVLPDKVYIWAHTSGKSGEYKYKWVPYTKKMYEILGKTSFSVYIFSSARWKGDIRLEIGDRCLYTVAPPPYLSGILLDVSMDQFDFNLLPDPAKAKKMDFFDRIQEGTKTALSEGIDFFFGITSILIRISEQLMNTKDIKKNRSLKKELFKLPIVMRLLKGKLKALLNGRQMLPKDLWNVKGIFCTGADTVIYKDKVKELWGMEPLEAYGSTELGDVANQSWNSAGLIFHPDNNFYEFIPVNDYYKMKNDARFVPKTLLLNELEEGEEYVLVGTNFHEGILTRYVTGDVIRIISLIDEIHEIYTPQMVFSTRADDIIDIGGFTRLSEKTLWLAIENLCIPYVDWIARKEYINGDAFIHFYIEFKEKVENLNELAEKLHSEIKALDQPYAELESITGMKPLYITILKKGAFSRYIEKRRAEGADLAHMKPNHINPSDQAVETLLEMSNWKL